jgi:hypothetical protein
MKTMCRLLTILLASISLPLSHAQVQPPPAASTSLPAGWPRTFTANGTAFTVYQPQATSLENGVLSFRMAVSATPQGAAAPGFGTVKLTAITTSNPDGTTVALNEVAVVKATFPSFPDQAMTFAQAVAAQAQSWGQSVSLQAIQANLAVTEAESKKPKAVAVQNPVPKIILSQSPAVLVLVDGQPALRPVAGSSLLRVINTQALIALDQSSGTFYLRINGGWVQSSQITGTWTPATNPPDALASLLQQATATGNVQLYNPQQGTSPSATPSVYVSTVPAELIVTQGAPNFQPVSGTQLLHAANTTSSLFMDVANQTYYLVISGRWFSTQNLSGAWQFVPANQLPADFANIPENAPAGTVLASVAGTKQAQEAAISASVPQTARIARTSPGSVAYDGAPKFSKISGTELSYAVNTATPVVKVSSSRYYAVINGVWFKAPSPNGPWVVADKVPSSIYTIPPSCPIYYATSVFVYGSTPDYVTVGYTPGYYGTCLSPEGVVVFGTGYNYVPYIGSAWIAPPLTYGFGAGLACGLATGFAFGMLADHGWGCWPSWGAWGGGWGGNTYNFNGNWGNVNAVQNNVYNRWGNNNLSNLNRQNFDQNHPQAASDMNRAAQNFQQNHPVEADRIRHQVNEATGRGGSALSQQQQDNLRQAEQNHPQATQDLHNDARRAADNGDFSRNSLAHDSSRLGDNNVFAGRDGNAYRSASGGGWQRQDGAGWHDTDNSFSRNNVGRDLDNQRFARNVGGFRDSGFGGGRSFGGGGFRGGGFRR